MAKLALFLTILYTQAVHGQLQGDECRLDDGTWSTCSDFASCPEAMQAVVANKLPPICSYVKNDPIVCCPRKTTTIRTTRATIISGIKSREKCVEYGQYVYVDQGGMTLIGGDDYDDDETTERQQVKQCGIKDEADGLIVGGKKADPDEFSHMAAIGFGEANDIAWLCGGSLISERFVLTAAHCMRSDDRGEANWVMLGDTDLTRKGNVGSPQLFSVIERIVHNGYRYPSSYNDIALLKLHKNARFNQYVRPACLHTEHSIGKDKGLASGYGKTNWMNIEAAGELMKVWLDFVPGDRCNNSLRNVFGSGKLKTGIHDDKMVCAGDPKGEKDTCAGDSGGPLQIILKNPECMYSIVGITSFGNYVCTSRNTPAVYTRVSNYVPWIESKVWP